MLGLKHKRIPKELAKVRERLLRRANEMRKLTLQPNSGWVEFISILNEYVDACMKRKALTALDIATDKEIHELKLLDHEVYIITQFVKVIPKKIFAEEETIQREINREGKRTKMEADGEI